MVQLDLDNIYLSVNGLEPEDETKIWNILSFPVQVFGMKEVRYRHVYNRKTKKTYAGLLQYVTEYLEDNDIEYKLNDNRIKPEQNGNFSLVEYVDKEKTIPLKLRPYQQKVVDNCREREIIQAATGAGKTCIMSALIPHFNVKPVLVFADKIGLCQQLKSELEKFLGVEVGLVGDGVKYYKDITVVSIQSAEDEYLEKAKMCLFDECFPYKTKVMLDNGRYEEIGLICHKMSKGEQFSVMSYNIETDEFEPKRVINYGKKNSSTTKFIRVRVQDSKGYKQEVTCTDNHKFFVYNKKEYIMAKDLKIDDEVVYVKRDRPNDWFKNDIWKVMAVDYVGRTTKYVYDLTVEDNHNFFADRVLVSNCHHIPSDTLSTVAMKCVNAYYRIGVSATPWRDTNDDILIEAALAKQNKEDYISASKLIELGYLVEPTIYFVPIKDKFKGKNYQQVYNSAIVLNENRNKIIYKIAQKMYEKNKHILILFKQVNHGTEIALNLQKIISNKTHPIKIVNPKNNKDVTIMVKEVELLSGSDDTIKRLAVFEAIRQGICRCLVASTIADEGLDLPILDTLILAGGGKSSTRAFQRVGRVLRLHEGKEKAIVFDFKDFTPMLRRHSRERQKYYLKEPAWNIKEFNVSPD